MRTGVMSSPLGAMPFRDVANIAQLFTSESRMDISGGVITKIYDESPNAHHEIKAAGSPVLVAGVQAGRPAIRMNESEEAAYFTVSAFFTTESEVEVWNVCASRRSSAAQNGPPLEMGTSGAGDLYPNSDGHIYTDLGSALRVDCGDHGAAARAFNIYRHQLSGGNRKVWIGATQILSEVCVPSWGGTFYTGASAGLYFKGDKLFRLITKRALTSGEATSLSAWLTAQYGL